MSINNKSINNKSINNKKVNKVGFWLNEDKPEGAALAALAASALRARGITVCDAKEAGGMAAAERPQLAVVFGGDGTMIAAARAMAKLAVPLVGVNMGRLGFLMSLEAEDMPAGLLRMVQGEYVAEQRLMIEGRLRRGGREIAMGVAQNDIVVNNGISRMIGLELAVDGHPALEMKGDGLVVATPTGSTAYSLSAGGAIVLPECEVMLVTPVAAHNLYSRPMVVPGGSRLTLKLSALSQGGAARVTFDGQYELEAGPEDELQICRCEPEAVFWWPEEGMFLKRLKSKLMSKG